MKALILAGGFGTRLRPISCTRPKLLFPIANKPILDLTLRRLAESGVTEVILAVSFMADALERAFGKSKHRIRLHYSRDALPDSSSAALGTGGAIKQAENLLRTEECFFALNGDILSEANYLKILQHHREKGRMATVALQRVEDPSRYGVVKLSKEGLIEEFVEKPTKDAPSNLVNAGIYVFNSEIFEYIPPGKACSIEREVFPKISKERKLLGHEISSLWIDVGKPVDYIKANRIWIARQVEALRRPLKGTDAEKNASIQQPVCIDENVGIGKNSEIGPNVSIGRGCLIGADVRIQGSIIFPSVEIRDQTAITGTVIGEGVKIGEKVTIGKGCLIGDRVTIRDGVRLVNNVKVCPYREVSSNASRGQCVI